MSDDVRADARRLLQGIDPVRPYDVEILGHDDRWKLAFGVYAADSLLAVTHSKRHAEFIAAAPELVERLLAELDRAHTWDGLIALLDEHYPADIFPTAADTPDRDPGPRIISLIRSLDAALTLLARIQAVAADVDQDGGHSGLARHILNIIGGEA